MSEQNVLEAVGTIKIGLLILGNRIKAKDAALDAAIAAAEYVVKLCEANYKAGQSPNPNERSMPEATIAHVYAAMAFVEEARKARTL